MQNVRVGRVALAIGVMCSWCCSADVIVGVASSMEAVFPKGPYAKAVTPAAEARLKLARGEHESLQLLVSCPAKDLRNVSVTASDLVRVRPWYAVWAADSIPSGCIDCDVVGYAWAEFPTNSRYSCSHSVCRRTETAPFYRRSATRAVDSWWPDPILDFLPAVDVARGDVQSFWIRLHCPDGQAAGEYEGTLTVAAEGVAVVRLPFRVRVYGFSVPKASPLPLAITYSPMTHTRDHSAESKAAAERCAADPEGPVRQAKARPLDWGDFLADYYITFDSLYTHTNLNFEVLARLKEQGRLGRFNLGYWSYFKDGADAEARWRAETLPRLKANYAKAKELGILDRAYAYGCDEVNTNYFDNIRKCVQILKEELPGVPISTTAYDDEFGVGTQLDVMDWFTPLTPKFNVEKAAASRRAGHQVWWYICCGPGNPWANTFTQCPPLEARMLMGAQTVRMRPDGFLYYEISIWNAERPIDKGPYTDWVPRSYMTLNGDGCWTAVGPGGKPLPTLRLENFRDGLEDYAYAKLLEERIAGRDDADMRVRKAKELLAVPRQVMDTMSNYTNDPAEIAAWRDAMAELIESLD